MNTCKHCGRPIDRNETGYWVHTDTKTVRCDPDPTVDSTNAQP